MRQLIFYSDSIETVAANNFSVSFMLSLSVQSCASEVNLVDLSDIYRFRRHRLRTFSHLGNILFFPRLLAFESLPCFWFRARGVSKPHSHMLPKISIKRHEEKSPHSMKMKSMTPRQQSDNSAKAVGWLGGLPRREHASVLASYTGNESSFPEMV